MRSRDRANKIIRIANVRYPIAQRLVHGVLQGLAARVHHPHFGAQKFHAKNVQRLSRDILLAHENFTI